MQEEDEKLETEGMDAVSYRGREKDLGETERLIADSESGSSLQLSNYGTETEPVEEVDDVEFEEALSRTGYGRFHYLVLLLCGWAVSSDAIEVLSISFILPPAGCDLNLSTFDKGTLNSIIFVGMMVGGYTWGAMSDIYGRRRMLVWSLALNGLGGIVSSLSQSYYLFLVMRLISGIGVGGSQPLIFSYFVEFQPKARRGAMVSFLASFWVSGNIIAAGLAWAVIPQTELSFSTADFTYNSWRVYIAFCTIPAFSSALLFLCMPESPKFLLQADRADEALSVLKRVYHRNVGRDVSTYPVRSLLINNPQRKEQNHHHHVTGRRGRLQTCCYKFKYTLRNFGKKTARLFERRLLKTTLVAVYVFATLSFGYYGLFMWLPELFARMDKYGGSACDTTYVNSSIIPTESPNNGTCDPDQDGKIYLQGFITALATMPGNVIAIFIMDKVGGRLLMAMAMIGSGVCVFFFWFVNNELEGFIISCIFSGVANVGWVALDVVVVEIFPTEVRATAMGVTQITARTSGILGNVAFGALVNTNCTVPMLLVVFFLATGGLAALLLPNKRQQDLE